MIGAGVLARRVAGLPSWETRRAALGAHLAGLAPEDAARALDQLARCSPGASAELGVALASLLVAERAAFDRAAVREAAAGLGLVLVAALLADAPARRALPPRARLAEVAVPWHYARAGWQAQAGRAPAHPGSLVARRLERLAHHPSPRALAALLDAPLTPQALVVAAAAQRPTTPARAFAIARRDRWLAREPVREALAENPFTPARIALAVAPTVGAPLLARLAADTAPGEPLHEAAAALLAERHPRP